MNRRQNASQKCQSPLLKCPPKSRIASAVIIPRHLSETEDSRSMHFFFSSWVCYARDPLADRGILELLPAMLPNSKVNSPLSHCVAAISLCMFTKWEYRLPDAETPKVRGLYTKALAATSSELQDPADCLSEETLMAVCLLGFYELRQ